MEVRVFRIKTVISIFQVMDQFGLEYYCPPGSDGSAKCPYHGDDFTPSAYVYSESNSLYCHKCQQQWDVIALFRNEVSKYGGPKCSFSKALHLMEKQWRLPHIPFPEEDDDEEEETPPPQAAPDPEKAEAKPREAVPTPEVEDDEEEEVEDTEAAKEAAKQEFKKQLWRSRIEIDKRLIEARDGMSLNYYVKFCTAVDSTFWKAERYILDGEQLKARLKKVRSKLTAIVNA